MHATRPRRIFAMPRRSGKLGVLSRTACPAYRNSMDANEEPLPLSQTELQAMLDESRADVALGAP